MPAFPTGTVTFLFSDVEGSTKRWEEDSPAMLAAIERHFALLDDAIAANNGVRYKIVGDAVQAAFPSAVDGLRAAVAAQRATHHEDWGALGPLHVRMALHTGAATPRDGDYLAPSLNRLARLLSAAAGGQILVSETTRDLLRDALPAGIALRNLGEHRLRDLREPETVFQVIGEDLPTEFPPLRSQGGTAGNLPAELTSFVGRTREVAEAERLLIEQRVRMLTITGAGGTGKSRLALHVASALGPHFRDGVWLVALTSVPSAGQIVRTIGETLAIREIPGEAPEATLRAHLKQKRLLLLLDNFEHLLSGAPLLADLLAYCPDLQVMVTSRAPLRVAGEHELAIHPLPVPGEDEEQTLDSISATAAVQLFLDRVQSVRRDFVLTNENAPVIAAICRELDGLPLAIELAAARARLLSPEAILSRLGNRLTLLTGGGRDRPERHQTMRQAIAWSHDLLEPHEQVAFRRASVFAEGFSLEAAEAVWAGLAPALSPLDALTALHENSLIRQLDVGELADSLEPRFGMLRTIQEFAAEMLVASGEHEAIQEAHAGFFSRFAREAAPNLSGRDAVAWLNRLETDHDNLRVALDWYLERRDATQAVLLASALWRFWWLRGRINEGRQQLEAALGIGIASGVNSALAAALDGAGVLAETQGDYDRAESSHRQALALSRNLDDQEGIARALNNLGVVAFDRGDLDRSEALITAGLALARETESPDLIATALNDLGRLAYHRRDFPRAEALYQESLTLRRVSENVTEIARSLNNLGIVAHDLADFATARRLFEESLALYRQTEDAWGAAAPIYGLARSLLFSGETARATALLEESLALFRETGDRRNAAVVHQLMGIGARESGERAASAVHFHEALLGFRSVDDRAGVIETIVSIAGLQIDAGNHEAATRLLGASAAALDADDSDRGEAPRDRFGVDALMARSALGESIFHAAWNAGRGMTLTEAIAEAMSATMTKLAPAGNLAVRALPPPDLP